MTQSKHTSGPWHIGNGNGEGSIFANGGRMKLESGGTALYPICKMITGWEDAEDGANARLVASAPELLEAAQSIHSLCLMVDVQLDIEARETQSDSYVCANYHNELKHRLPQLWAAIVKARPELSR